MTEPAKLILRSSASRDTCPETGLILGRALAMDYKSVVVARDYMRSSTMMKEALVAGLTAHGADVIDLGCASFPVLGMHASKGECAVYITEYREFGRFSGYVLVNSDGGLFRTEQIRRLERVFEENPEPASDPGTVRTHSNATDEYNRKLASVLKYNAECAVVLDCNCGTSALSAPQVLNGIGADLVSMNAQFDRSYMAHSLIPSDSDLRDLRQFIGSDPGTVGVALNRTGNLLTALDEKGRIIDDEVALALIIMLRRPSRLVVPMDISSLVIDAFHGNIDVGLRPSIPVPEERMLYFTIPNSGAICGAMKEYSAQLGYYNGGYIFDDISLAPDAIHATCMIAEIAAENSLSRLVAALPTYQRDEKVYRITCTREEFRRMMDSNTADMAGVCVSNSYGWRITMDDGWFLVRMDNYEEDKVIVIAESRDRAYLVGMAEVAKELVDSCSRGQ